MRHAGGKLRNGGDFLRAQEVVLEIAVPGDVLDHEDGAQVLVLVVLEGEYPQTDEPLVTAGKLLPGVLLLGGDLFLDLPTPLHGASLQERGNGLVHQTLVLEGKDLDRREVHVEILPFWSRMITPMGRFWMTFSLYFLRRNSSRLSCSSSSRLSTKE